MIDAQRTVLIAATDPDAVAEYRSWLTGAYRVETTTDGSDALARLEAVDVALIGRDLRTADGTVVARAVERRGAGYAMAILRGDDEPDRDRTAAVELTEPVSNATLCETVDRLLCRVRYDELIDECAALAAGDAPENAGPTPTATHRTGTVSRNCSGRWTRCSMASTARTSGPRSGPARTASPLEPRGSASGRKPVHQKRRRYTFVGASSANESGVGVH